MAVPAVVLVTTSFPISGDGSEAAGGFVADLAQSLGERVPVRVVAPGRASDREDWAPGVVVHRYAAPERPLSTLRPWRLSDLRAIRSVMASGLAATRSAVGEGSAHHILALWALPSGHWARVVAREAGVPYSVWTLGSDIWSLGRVPLVRSYLRRVLRGADQCYSDGLKLAEDTRKIAGREVEFLPSTRRILSVRTLPPRQTPPYRLLFLGRWHPNKGVDLLLEALELLEDADWSRVESVTICGGGPLERVVDKGVRQLRERGRPVVQRGFLTKMEAEKAILESDFLLIPSRIESIPVVFSDAVKLGCPVVCTPVGDLPLLLSSYRSSGVLSAHATPADFACALRKAISRDQGSGRFDTSAVADKFSLAKVCDSVLRGVDADRSEPTTVATP